MKSSLENRCPSAIDILKISKNLSVICKLLTEYIVFLSCLVIQDETVVASGFSEL